MDFFPFLDSSSGFAMRLGISFVCLHNTDGSVRASHPAATGSKLSDRIFSNETSSVVKRCCLVNKVLVSVITRSSL